MGSTWRPGQGMVRPWGSTREEGQAGELVEQLWGRCLQEAGSQAGECWRVRGREGDTGSGEQRREKDRKREKETRQ